MKNILLFLLGMLWIISSYAQHDFYKNQIFTKADTLRGMLRPERTCYDVTFYDLNLQIDIDNQSIYGSNDIHYEAKENFDRLQIDLFKNMEIKSILFENRTLNYERIENAVFVNFPPQVIGKKGMFSVKYSGKPIVAKSAPWDGGFVWQEDENGKPWIAVACEGTGASLWWPNKDHLSDEPDSMSIKITVPDSLFCVSNGNLKNKEKLDDGFTRYDWFVSYPINNYNVSINIAYYSHFSDIYEATDGSKLALDYYVLPYNLEKAKIHFEQVHKILACYERYFGKYPFWNDGYALVETPYLGMEHQSAIAYGNNYMRGYSGGMIPSDMNWDYLIVHETGHEYWGNSISSNDHAEMWIHESFTTYMEALYVECAYSYTDAVRYLNHFRNSVYILNQEPILGPMDVNWDRWSGSDHYFKGSWILHTLRHSINDDTKFFDLLKSFYEKNAIKNIKTEDFIQFVNRCTQENYSPFFEQYLEYASIPTFIYEIKKDGNDLLLRYKWDTNVKDFNMPLLVGEEKKYIKIRPSTKWKSSLLKNIKLNDFKIATELFLINVEELE